MIDQTRSSKPFLASLFSTLFRACVCPCVIQYFFFFFFKCSSCPRFILWVPQDRKEKGGLQCLKWVVSQCPWSFPSCRNLITNNRWHIRDWEMQVCFVCACAKKDSVHVDVFNTESDKKGRGRYCGEGRVFAHNRASFCRISTTNTSARSRFTCNEYSCVSSLCVLNPLHLLKVGQHIASRGL